MKNPSQYTLKLITAKVARPIPGIEVSRLLISLRLDEDVQWTTRPLFPLLNLNISFVDMTRRYMPSPSYVTTAASLRVMLMDGLCCGT